MSQIKQALDRAEAEVAAKRDEMLREFNTPTETPERVCFRCGKTKFLCICDDPIFPAQQRTDRELLNALGAALGRVEQLAKGIDAQTDAVRFICEERFERIEKTLELLSHIGADLGEIENKLDALQAGALLRDFQKGTRPTRRKKGKR